MAIFFDNYDAAISRLKEDWINLEVLKDTEVNLIMEGDIILKYLNNEEKISEIKNKKCLLLEGPDDGTILMLYTEINDRIEDIWNWKLVYILANEYCIIEKEKHNINPLDWFHKLINKTFKWNNAVKILNKNSNVNDYLLIQRGKDRAIRTALRCVLHGGHGADKNIVTELDGTYLFTSSLDTLSLEIFRALESTSRRGFKQHILFSFKHMTEKTLGMTIDGYSLSELLEYGLIDRLNDFFDYKNTNITVTYEENKEKGIQGITNILINW